MREDRKGGIEKRGLKTKSWKKRDGKKGGLNGKGLKEERQIWLRLKSKRLKQLK